VKSLLLELAASHPDVVAAEKAEKKARYNSPEARRARSERSRKAAATRKARREAQEALEADMEAREPVGPVCGFFGVILQAQEAECIRPPHKHGDHEDISGNRWPSYEGEYDEMLVLTATDLRGLLQSTAEKPVLYVARDEDTGEPVRLELWAEALVSHGDIIVRQRELVDALGGPDHPDGVTQEALEHLLEGYQAKIDAMEEASEVPDDACVLDGTVYPEHDFPPPGEGDECRRCGAEADYPEPDGVYNGEIR
jgi:hypothetical protein